MSANASLPVTVITLLNNLLGSGMLSLPYGIYRSGSLLTGIVAMVIVSILNTLAALLLGRCAALTGIKSMAELCVHVLGKKFGRYLTLILSIYVIGSCCSYFALLADAFRELFDMSRYFILPILACTVFLVVSLPRNLSSLKYTAIISFLSILFVAAIIVKQAIESPFESAVVYVAKPPITVFSLIPVMQVSLTCHYNIPKFYSEMRNPKQFPLAIILAFGIASVLYIGVAAAGYIAFGIGTNGDVLENFSNDYVYAVAARYLIIIVMICAYPMAFNSLRYNVISLLPSRLCKFFLCDDVDSVPLTLMTPLRIGTPGGNDDVVSVYTADSSRYGQQEVGSPRRFRAVSPKDGKLKGFDMIRSLLRQWPHLLITLLLIGVTLALALAIPSLETILAYKGALGGSQIVFICGFIYLVITARVRTYAELNDGRGFEPFFQGRDRVKRDSHMKKSWRSESAGSRAEMLLGDGDHSERLTDTGNNSGITLHYEEGEEVGILRQGADSGLDAPFLNRSSATSRHASFVSQSSQPSQMGSFAPSARSAFSKVSSRSNSNSSSSPSAALQALYASPGAGVASDSLASPLDFYGRPRAALSTSFPFTTPQSSLTINASTPRADTTVDDEDQGLVETQKAALYGRASKDVIDSLVISWESFTAFFFTGWAIVVMILGTLVTAHVLK